MRMATYLAPSPGVLSGYDVNACAVVDTRCDRWLYLTGDSAWAWQTVCVTGGVTSLDESEMEHVQVFADLDLIRPEERDKAGQNPPESGCAPEPGRTTASTRRRMRRVARRSWWRALPLHRAPLAETIAVLNSLHSQKKPYLTPGEAFLITKDASRAPWWVPPQQYTDRSISTAAVLAAHQLQGRLDLCFGVCHRSQEPTFWCSSPQAGPEMGDDYLLVGRV
jgi:hypothetical protein